MQVGDVLQVTHLYQVNEQDCLNVFFYEVTALTVPNVEAFAVLDELSSQWEASIGQSWATGTTSVSIRVDNLSDGIEFSELQTGWSGQGQVNNLPSLVAMNVRLARDTKITRNGYKRISGFSEEQTTDNQWNLGANLVNNVNDYCATVRTFTDYDGAGNDCTWEQRIVGRTLQPNGSYAIDITKLNTITGIVINPNISSQVSRKP